MSEPNTRVTNAQVIQNLDPQAVQFATVKGTRGGFNIFEAFLLMFVGFKLAHIIAWSWIFVVAPAWIPLVGACALNLFSKVIRTVINKRMRNRW